MLRRPTTTRRRPRPGAGRGVPLWVHLSALVAVPLVGVAVLTAATTRSSIAEAASATRAEAAVGALAHLDTARSSVEQEILPTLALAVIDRPATATDLGLPVAVLAQQRAMVQATLQTARATTDEALAQTARGTYGADAAVRARAQLSTLRDRADTFAVSVEGIYLGYLAISNDLVHTQRAVAAAATAEGLPPRTQRAIQDVQVVAQLATAASRQTPLYLGAVFGGTGTLIGSQLAWETGWLAYSDALEQMQELSQTSLRTAWEGARGVEVSRTLDQLLGPAPGGGRPTSPDVSRMLSLLQQSGERDALLSGLVHTAADSARASAAADRDQAVDRRNRTLVGAVLVVLLSLLSVLVVGRAVARALRVLAGQAGHVSDGALVQVEVAGPREVRTVSAALASAVASLRRVQEQARAVARGDLDNALLAEPLPGPLGEVVHASVRQIVSSVRQREELQSALAHRAAHDPLTELPNRAQARQLTESALFRARRSGAMTGLLFVDLDGFKAVNDTHGHACGDEVLRAVAGRLESAVRSGDVVCRLGGDEFVVLVEPVAAERDLLELAERLIAEVSRPIAVGGHQLRVGASIGVAVGRDAATDADVLFAEADAAAYRAKRHGRGRAEVFDETLRAQLADRAELEAAVAAGLAAGEMLLHYQPVVDARTGQLTGFEALVRWDRPGVGMVPPDVFVPAAEGSRLICDLDRWVLHEATRQLAAWRGSVPLPPGHPEPTVAVNVSGRHLADRQVVTDVADALAASGLPAHLLVLEVTETVLVDDLVAIEHLVALRAMGTAIAIDDFGTGYTSIGQLRHMPVDTLKIDRSFVASTDPGASELVALMIRAAHTFGLTVVAEGVEEPGQLDRLRAEGCDHAQGFLLHRPLPPAAVEALLARTAVPAPR
ncbi:putative bifunctional diguanylate cyclase/phosphodiesterase [Modestobacter roseus]|uniref:putative bifunctional diguanylate cyclase/phosphodiesterase n=1 Tax=Modestobacter roseus TaxID=1181884 RepID=UPI0012965590|nr:bifunctional diguanylate cyclase/phosphodiesterase [Modestobacter roseus]MQA32499.1 EAL domain-containing protein [Modestobacter roseus]